MDKRTPDTPEVASPTLAADEPPPFAVHNAGARAPWLLVGDHAGNAVPRGLDALGLPPRELERHIGWDIGVAALGVRLSDRLGAVFIHQRYSRLVIDCNRAPVSPEAIPATSDGTHIPGNAALSAASAAARVADIHTPYHAAITAEIARRTAAGVPTVLIALHSFTPQLGVEARPWQIGVLHGGGNAGYARALLATLRAALGEAVGDNQPYQMDDTDYTVPHHAFAAGLSYAEIEIRQDLLGDAAAIERWCDVLEGALTAALNAKTPAT
ncbi:N-formylglutamate amidohydrolase [Polymorphobacter arshaanensis]|uniref:N-formylglutamate amidohydrolase n=1 Tax=Glacieibacterium arshaanense TaxID=2511025 RepID=UPI00140B6047|nr:N-formylglutamate amidohydrolase [Polymorphobacter arshaanensis]